MSSKIKVIKIDDRRLIDALELKKHLLHDRLSLVDDTYTAKQYVDYLIEELNKTI